MRCPNPSCGNEVAQLYSDGCATCHEANKRARLAQLQESARRVEASLTNERKECPPREVKAPTSMGNIKKTGPKANVQWTREELDRVLTELKRRFAHESKILPRFVQEVQKAILPEARWVGVYNYAMLRRLNERFFGAKSSPSAVPPEGGGGITPVALTEQVSAALSGMPEKPDDQLLLRAAGGMGDVLAQQIVAVVLAACAQTLEASAAKLREQITVLTNERKEVKLTNG